MDAPLICSIPGCERPLQTRGLCQTHYSRTLRGSDLYAPIRHRAKETRFDGKAKARHVLIAKTVCAETGPISPEEVVAIQDRLAHLSKQLGDHDPLDALLFVVHGPTNGPRTPVPSAPGNATDVERYEQERQQEELRELQAA